MYCNIKFCLICIAILNFHCYKQAVAIKILVNLRDCVQNI